ncbi:hypothetical protein HOY82DRAFT_652066 [Tuber indicum]|nr:hypothetical protein HOY82DRAFT_652066 [Tuber indicum]
MLRDKQYNNQESAQRPMCYPFPRHQSAQDSRFNTSIPVPGFANKEISRTHVTKKRDGEVGNSGATEMANLIGQPECVYCHSPVSGNASQRQVPHNPHLSNITPAPSSIVLVEQHKVIELGPATEEQGASPGIFQKTLNALARVAILKPFRLARRTDLEGGSNSRGDSGPNSGARVSGPIRGEAGNQSSSATTSYSFTDCPSLSGEQPQVPPPPCHCRPLPGHALCALDQEVSESFRMLDTLRAEAWHRRRGTFGPLRLPEVQGVKRSAHIPIPQRRRMAD